MSKIYFADSVCILILFISNLTNVSYLGYLCRYWADLTEDERQAATVLGYTAETWDKEGMLAKCCVIQ